MSSNSALFSVQGRSGVLRLPKTRGTWYMYFTIPDWSIYLHQLAVLELNCLLIAVLSPLFFGCNRTYVSCDLCLDWFHPECLKMSEREIEALSNSTTFFCPACRDLADAGTMVRRTISYLHVYIVEFFTFKCSQAALSSRFPVRSCTKCVLLSFLIYLVW